jgi:hypothetical protein
MGVMFSSPNGVRMKSPTVAEVPAVFIDSSNTLPYPNPNSSTRKPVGSGSRVPGVPRVVMVSL